MQQARRAFGSLGGNGEQHAEAVAQHRGIARGHAPLDNGVELLAVQLAEADDAEQLRQAVAHITLVVTEVDLGHSSLLRFVCVLEHHGFEGVVLCVLSAMKSSLRPAYFSATQYAFRAESTRAK